MINKIIPFPLEKSCPRVHPRAKTHNPSFLEEIVRLVKNIFSCYVAKQLFQARNLRQLGKTLLQILVTWNIIGHCSVQKGIIGGQIKETSAG